MIAGAIAFRYGTYLEKKTEGVEENNMKMDGSQFSWSRGKKRSGTETSSPLIRVNQYWP